MALKEATSLIEQIDESLREKLASAEPDQVLVKEAEDALTAYTRTKMREDGFTRRIVPPLPITNDELDRDVTSSRPMKIIDMEPDSPAAVSVPYATLPMNYYIRGRRYKVTMDRIQTPRFAVDVDDLRTWDADVRQILSDNSIRDMLAEEDGKFLTAVDTCLVGPGSIVPTSGVIQYEEIAGGINRDSLWDMMKVLPSTPSHLEVHTNLTNNITIKEICKMGRDEIGGDFSQDLMQRGWSESDFMGSRWIATIKTDLVGNNTVYNFADPKFLGKFLILEDATMYVKREAFMLEFYSYENLGLTIANTNSLSRVDFV